MSHDVNCAWLRYLVLAVDLQGQILQSLYVDLALNVKSLTLVLDTKSLVVVSALIHKSLILALES